MDIPLLEGQETLESKLDMLVKKKQRQNPRQPRENKRQTKARRKTTEVNMTAAVQEFYASL